MIPRNMDKKNLTEEVVYFVKEEKFVKEQTTEQNFLSESAKVAEKYPAKSEKPLLLLITGGAAAGKTTLIKKVKEYLEASQKKVLILSLDSYYSYSPLLFQTRNPVLHQIFLWSELNKDLETLLSGGSIYLPIYDNSEEKKFMRSTILVESTPTIMIEGILALFDEAVRKKSDLKIYLEVKEEIRLERRLERYKKGLAEKKFHKPVGYEIERFYKGPPKKNQEIYVEPTKQYADLIIDNNNYEGNIEQIVEAINKQVEKADEQG